VLDKVNIISVDSDWVRYGQGRNDRFRYVRTAGGFVINATELRSVNFSMQAVDVPLRFTPSRRHGRRAAVLTAPVPKRYKMHKDIDTEVQVRLGGEIKRKRSCVWVHSDPQNLYSILYSIYTLYYYVLATTKTKRRQREKGDNPSKRGSSLDQTQSSEFAGQKEEGENHPGDDHGA